MLHSETVPRSAQTKQSLIKFSLHYVVGRARLEVGNELHAVTRFNTRYHNLFKYYICVKEHGKTIVIFYEIFL